MTEFCKSLIILDGYFDIEYKIKRFVIDELTGNENFLEFGLKTNKLLKDRGVEIKNYLKAFTDKNYDNLIKSYDKKGIVVINESSENYPSDLYSVEDRPVCLYLMGNAELLNAKNKFSIVGSRKTLPSILKITEEYAKTLSQSGVVIVTGVAGGGDLASIKGALSSGNLICVLAGGFDNISNEYTHEYIKNVISSGLLVSEYPPSVKPMPYFYPRRNRLFVALSKGVLVTSGSFKSGTRHTANYALDYGKDVFAFPYGLNVTSGEICNQIIKDGGYLVTDISDIAEVCGFDVTKKEKVPLNEVELKVLSVIKTGIVTVDNIIQLTGLKICQLMPVLTALEIKKLIVKSGADNYQPI